MINIGFIFMLFAVALSLAGMIFWIWALIDALRRPDESYGNQFGSISPKLVWALIIIFGQLIGALIYLFVAGSSKNPQKTVIQIEPTATEEGRRILDMIAAGKITSEEGQRLLAALGKKEIEQATQKSGSSSRGMGIGCFLLLLIPISIISILVLLYLVFIVPHYRYYEGPHITVEADAQQAMENQPIAGEAYEVYSTNNDTEVESPTP